MKNLFDTTKNITDDLEMRVYTSQILGQDSNLVLHGGGNTSVKIDNTLYVKGSGWNLDTIEKEGFSPVDLDVLIEMASRDELSDTQMVKEQRAALRNQDLSNPSPSPSIEAILHAIIPFKFVDHTHADAVVTISNTPNGKKLIQDLYGENMLIIDYVMPGFILAKKIFDETRDVDFSTLDGIILLNHGVFTFDDDAKVAYDKMINIVTLAEEFIASNTTKSYHGNPKILEEGFLDQLQQEVANLRGCNVLLTSITTPQAITFSNIENIKEIVHRGGLTPEHVIRIKPFPAIIYQDINTSLKQFTNEYMNYFKNNSNTEHIMLDIAPKYAIIPGYGVVIFAKDEKEQKVSTDIVTHTICAILTAEQLESWTSLKASDLFEMEYWELEQAKLKK